MSIVADQVRRVDSALDGVLQLVPRSANDDFFAEENRPISSSPRIAELQGIVKALSTTSSSSPLLSSWRILQLLERAALSEFVAEDEQDPVTSKYEADLEWLLVSKATVQTYGLLMGTLLEQTIPLNDDIWYWDEVLGSYTYSSLYTVQTSPLRLWIWSKGIYIDTKGRLERVREDPVDVLSAQEIGTSLTDQWKQFYGLVKESIRDSSVAHIQQQVLSPIALCRSQARHNQARLRRLRELGASGLGMLMDEGLNFDVSDDDNDVTKSAERDMQEWKFVVERSVALMDTVLRNVTTLDTGISDFEDNVFATVDDDPEITTRESTPTEIARPSKLGMRLQHILEVHVPNHVACSQALVAKYGRPPRLIRYWLPAAALLLSSTTILRIFVNRQAEIITWIRDLGATTRDFWLNWVVEPTKKVIGTIRHDKDSEVAIMSKDSLKGDRESLERMVVEFAIDNPSWIGETSLNEIQIAEIRSKVKAGDLTTVLRAYEKDLRKPFVGALRGDLVRTLLIQVQKTKVDLEVALSGIDALLKSQELVFGCVGLTPGILVCFAAFRYLGGVLGSRKGFKQGQKARETVRVLRNIDRILTLATPTHNNLLSYKDHGLLLCEVHVLRQRAHKLFPTEVEREFLEDLSDLGNINSGIGQQLRVLERIRWGYAKWLR
ncbi:related to NCA2 protein [Rhynchosporium secalis]|uniref:Related to NCA2 protein n=1 Tax=Rhynchosporium secalis TaxID=38038 RepID=A0A1E1MBX2_RHYSE|nr:related to NCA2 protein [Rhynchosporium secalis]